MIVAALGDSLCGGYFNAGDYVDDPNGSYPALVAQQIGATQLGVVSIRGAMIVTIAERIPHLPADADLLLVSAGTNDMVDVAWGVRTLAEVRENFDGMLRLSRSWMPNARIVVTGLRDVAAMDPDLLTGEHSVRRLRFPDKVHAATLAFNEHALGQPETTPIDLARRSGASSIELFPDAVHPSPLGVRWMADAVLEGLR